MLDKEAFNSLSRDHYRPQPPYIECLLRDVTFNSLSRDHAIMRLEMRLGLDVELSIPSLGITLVSLICRQSLIGLSFQFPLSGSQASQPRSRHAGW